MLRLSPPDGLRLVQANAFDAAYGGSEANVAVSLAQFGMATRYITRVPNNELGKSALSAVSRYGVETTRSVWGGERLGAYYIEFGAGRRGSKVLYDRQNSGMATLEPGQINWRDALAGAAWLHWSGITPALSESAAAATLEALQVASDMGLRISCDLNYRDKLWKYGQTPAQVMPALVEYTHVLLGDATAFDLFFGIEAPQTEDLLKRVAKRFPKLTHIAMTSRAGLSASHNTYKGMLFDGAQVFESRTYELPDMLDRIGGGDAFMAGLIFGLTKMPDHPHETVEFAVAAAALKHYVRGDFNLTTEQEVRALMGGNMGGKVSR